MTNEMKLLTALTEALGFEIEEAFTSVNLHTKTEFHPDGLPKMASGHYVKTITSVDYKLTKKSFNSKPTLHKIIRQYEKEGMTASEMIGRIMLHEGISNEDL